MARLYKWTRKHYERDDKNAAWRHVSSEVHYITETRAIRLTSKSELDFFKAIGSYVRLTRDNYRETWHLLNINLSRVQKTVEDAEPVDITEIWDAMGSREYDAMKSAYYSDEEFHQEEGHADYAPVLTVPNTRMAFSLKTGKWVN